MSQSSEPTAFREGMSRLGAAITVLTSDGPAGRHGMTASAVVSVTDSPPTLIVCGSGDPVTTTENGRFMQERIAGAELVEFYAAHLSNVQAGDEFSQRVLDFLRA